MSGEFCDTNVLVYAYDSTAGAKRDRAVELLSRLWTSGTGVISVQVLQELFVALTRKVQYPLSVTDAREVISDMTAWRVVRPSSEDVLSAIDGVTRWQVSFWDAMMLTMAIRAGAETVWSEDLNDGQRYDGAIMRNPFFEHLQGNRPV